MTIADIITTKIGDMTITKYRLFGYTLLCHTHDIKKQEIKIFCFKLKFKHSNGVKNLLNKDALADEYQKAILKIRKKINKGNKVKVIFLVNMASMFPAENLMREMLKDNMFDVKLYVIPDVRFGKKDMVASLEATYNELSKKYDFAKMAVKFDRNGEISDWDDVVNNADIVCYPSPYDLSYSPYNPYYAAKKGVLSIHIDYGFLRSKYDRLIYQSDNYNNFWKVFIETELNREEYYNYGQCEAANAVVTGYAKMDSLAQYKHINTSKKTIIIAPHHSVEGGTNHILALSNFEAYADLFLKIPEMYPDIDFIFRPHPVLFKILRQKKHWGNKRVDEYLDKMLSHNNVTYSTSGDYLEVFAKSDGIIQDCGSYLVEYFYTKKPCCYMLKSPSDIENKFSELGKQCLGNCYIAYNQEDILDFLNNVIVKGIDPQKQEREQFAEKQVMINYPCASAKIISEIKSILKGC